MKRKKERTKTPFSKLKQWTVHVLFEKSTSLDGQFTVNEMDISVKVLSSESSSTPMQQNL